MHHFQHFPSQLMVHKSYPLFLCTVECNLRFIMAHLDNLDIVFLLVSRPLSLLYHNNKDQKKIQFVNKNWEEKKYLKYHAFIKFTICTLRSICIWSIDCCIYAQTTFSSLSQGQMPTKMQKKTWGSMVLILDGNSLKGAHLRRNLYYSTCLRLLISSRAVTNLIFFIRKDLFSFMREQHVMSYHLI